ncbi:hypothetical protein [Streptomyces luteireticuli]|uniref:hypothetical protein n=1 Tax=Streptomyces luteireticuli TaxID=173858 RepID=UPI003558EB84
MTEPGPTDSYAHQARLAGTLVCGLHTLIRYAAREPALSAALAVIDTTEMNGPLDRAGLQAALAEAERERDLYSALAERGKRREEAGLGPGAPCACGHPAAAHAHRLTDDDRLPCHRDDCRCLDLAFSQETR